MRPITALYVAAFFTFASPSCGTEDSPGTSDSDCGWYLTNCAGTGSLADEIYEQLYECNQICDSEEGRRQNNICAFIACSRETGLCDNEHEGDPEISECLDAHGWR